MLTYLVRKFLNEFFDQKPDACKNVDNIGKKNSYKYKHRNISIITYSDNYWFFERYKNNELTEQYKKRYFDRMATAFTKIGIEYLVKLENLFKFDYVDMRLWLYKPNAHLVFEFGKKLDEGIFLRFFQNTFSECNMDIYIDEEYRRTIESVEPMVIDYLMGRIDIKAIHLITEEYKLNDDFLNKIGFRHFLYEDDEAEKLIIRNELNNINEFYIINSIPRR